MKKYQTEKTKRAEVEYRDGDINNPVPPFCYDRAKETIKTFREIGLEPRGRIGDIGAGRCERTLAVVNEYRIDEAYAFDISPSSLKASEEVAFRVFGNISHRQLKLEAGDFMESKVKDLDGLMTWATIHHFPDPVPFFEKAHSMLKPGGWFFFCREPLRSFLGLHELKQIWLCIKNGENLYKIRRQGILEASFPLRRWQEAFDIFDHGKVETLYPLKLDPREQKMLARIFGGRLRGLLYK